MSIQQYFTNNATTNGTNSNNIIATNNNNTCNNDITKPQPPPSQSTQTTIKLPYDWNIAYGNDIRTITKAPTTLRLYHHNIRGAKQYESWDQWKQGQYRMSQLQIDIATLVETNTAWTYNNITTATTDARKHHPQIHLNTSGSIDTNTGDYQPGGTACSIHGRWTGRVTERLDDPSGLGRWSGFRLEGKQKHSIVILSAYRPTQSSNMGDNTCYSQQWRIMRQRNTKNDDPKPRTQYITDLIALIKKWTNDTTEIIIGIDANDSLDNPKSDLLRLLNETTLVDLNPTTEAPATYARGSSCIDFFLGTPKLRQATTAHGHIPFFEGAWNSDHRAIFLDLDTRILFEGHTYNIAQTQQRHVHSNNISQTTKFISHIQNSNTLPTIQSDLIKLQQLEQWTPIDHHRFEELDRQFTKELLTAEQACKCNYSFPWSPKLHAAFLIQAYWRKDRSGRFTNKNVTASKNEITRQLQDPHAIWQGDPNRSPRLQLTKATANIKQIRATAKEHRLAFLEAQHRQHIAQGKTTAAKIVQSIRKAEKRKRCFHTIRHFSKNRASGGLTHILVTEHNQQVRIQNRPELEHRLHQRNTTHFAQAKFTPCANGPLADLLGPTGFNEHTSKILQGEWDPNSHPDIPEAAHKILLELKQQRETIPTTFTLDQMVAGFHKWRESTSTSPSGKHLGLYKTLTKYY